jgi:UDP-glucose 4-epimerase
MGKVLITGGAGFIGRNLVAACERRGHQVVVLDRRDYPGGATQSVRGSILDPAAVACGIRGAEVVFHEAGVTSPAACAMDPEGSRAVNVEGTEQLLEAALKAGVPRVVMASSSAVYGRKAQPWREDSGPLLPADLYGQTKLAAEKVAMRYAALGLCVISLRYFNTYGVGELDKPIGRSVVCNLIVDLVEGRAPLLYGDGRQARDFISVQDVVEANFLAAERGRAGEIYNVGSGTPTSFLDILDVIQSEAGTEVAPRFMPLPHPAYQLFTRADVGKAARDLGFSARRELRSGVRELLAWVRRQKAVGVPLNAEQLPPPSVREMANSPVKAYRAQ